MKVTGITMGSAIQDKDSVGHGSAAPIVLRLLPVVNLSDDQFVHIAQINRDLRIERNAQGELVIMPPTGGETGDRNAEITMQLRLWAKQDGMGTAFDSSTGFILPDNSVRSPDASWVSNSRLNALTREDRRSFVPLCPDFVIELRSPTDALSDLDRKMCEYIENGALLGWLIDPDNQRVFVYRPNEPVKEIGREKAISAPDVLPGFELQLTEIW